MADYIHEMRALVGHRPMILNTAAGALLDDNNRLLLQERADTGDWSFQVATWNLVLVYRNLPARYP